MGVGELKRRGERFEISLKQAAGPNGLDIRS
jgi:hypothetical protein